MWGSDKRYRNERGKRMEPRNNEEFLMIEGVRQKHVDAIKGIHKILNGVEWRPETIEEVADIVTGLGYVIHGPGELPSTWELSATIDIKMVGSEVESVTVNPAQGSDAFVWWDGDKRELTQDDVNYALSRYLGATKHTRNGRNGQTVYQLGWKS